MQKTVFVSGADRGLGYELSKKYVENGDVVFAGKYKTNWHLLEELQKSYPGLLHIVNLDVRCGDSVQAAADFVKSKTDSIDILLNVAGVWLSDDTGTVLDGKFDFERMMAEFNVNALGTLRVTQALVKLVLNSYEKLIVNISSEAGSIDGCAKDSQPGYCMSKASVNMQSVVVFNAIKRYGGNVMNIHPGWMQSVIGSATDAPDENYIGLPIGIRYYVTPEQTAASIVELLKNPERFNSDKPAFINFAGDRMKW
jgi:NAD(P)-dependent dehydrogenase (short-subunit alcohol dehydrogenase family)